MFVSSFRQILVVPLNEAILFIQTLLKVNSRKIHNKLANNIKLMKTLKRVNKTKIKLYEDF